MSHVWLKMMLKLTLWNWLLIMNKFDWTPVVEELESIKEEVMKIQAECWISTITRDCQDLSVDGHSWMRPTLGPKGTTHQRNIQTPSLLHGGDERPWQRLFLLDSSTIDCFEMITIRLVLGLIYQNEMICEPICYVFWKRWESSLIRCIDKMMMN